MKNAVVYLAVDHLLSQMRFRMPRKAVCAIMVNRGVGVEAPYVDCEKRDLRLCYADMLKWLLIGPSKVNNVLDSDNGWSHTEAGYELSSADRADLRAEANAIYKELEPTSVLRGRTGFKIHSMGICRANRDVYGDPLPHIER